MRLLNICIETVFRLAIWYLFLSMDKRTPVIRHIDEEEMYYYQYPTKSSYVPKRYIYMIMIGVPSVIFFFQYIINRKVHSTTADIISQICGLTLAYCINGIFTASLKLAVGRPRPNFFRRCFPDGYGTNINECTGIFRRIMDGRKSFPSGHASFSFTCLIYMLLHLKKIIDLRKPRFGRGIIIFAMSLLPLGASLVAASRTADYHHHYSDVLAGAVLGSTVAYAVHCCYATVPEISAAEIEETFLEFKKIK